ncbi:MAG: Glu/Leu/Phe/Val dehydrogenase [Planctomycetes bacterium]|nr:Glu/Leu/Phe/Val dehydrogenase [Planctomycetota bacterium]
MRISDLAIDGYECVRHAVDESSGLNAFIAVHDTTFGPGLGGMRIWPYDSEDAALTDVLRLAEGMTYKSAIAKTGLGGGKSVIVGEPRQVRNPEALRAMGRFIDSFEGRYITAEDVNTRIVDLEVVRETTRWVTGLAREKGGSGNPAPYTARGVYLGIRVSLDEAFGSESPKDRRIAVQGAGAVASHVVEMLLEDGAKIAICDIKAERVDAIVERFPEVEVVDAAAIYDYPCDVFAPHALGAVINDETVDRLQCKVVAGAANNQLATEGHGRRLMERGIVFAPDFVINAGGIINVSCELNSGGYDEATALAKIDHIQDALRSTFKEARDRKISTGRAAVEVARRLLDQARS